MRSALLVAATLLSATPALAADPVEGEWVTTTGGGKVLIKPCADDPERMCGAVSWLPAAMAKALDARNANPALKTRPILGAAIVMGFKQAAPGKWTGGKLYDPSSGKTYDGRLTANANGTLKVEGCVMRICQGQTWKRS